MPIEASIAAWIDRARAKLTREPLAGADLDELAGLANAPRVRQRLLYLTAQGMSPLSSVLSTYAVDPVHPVEGARLEPKARMPYRTIHDAMVDGWRVVRFPDADRASEDRELGVYGYLFVLEKLEAYRD